MASFQNSRLSAFPNRTTTRLACANSLDHTNRTFAFTTRLASLPRYPATKARTHVPQKEIEKTKRSVITDAYQMSIGEVVNLYRDRELIINPNFQRLYRWNLYQKSRLIESILLGIPLPSIFVFETEDGPWELVDGLQRVSTLLEFMGLLVDPDTKRVKPPMPLVGTKYLPSLEGVYWDKAFARPALDKSFQINIRRSRLSIEILKQPSDAHTKYDLFQRLNAGGTAANAQELRNVVTIMIDEDCFAAIKAASEDAAFLSVIQVTDDGKRAQRHIERAMRFLVYLLIDYDNKKDVEEYVDDGIVEVAEKKLYKKGIRTMLETFALIKDSVGVDGLRRMEGGHFKGFVGLSALEAIAVGIGQNLTEIKKLKSPQKYVEQRVREFWERPEIDSFSAPGLRGTQRLQRTLPFGKQWFAP